MKYTILLLIIGLILIIIPINNSQPSFNGTDPGCNCHTFSDGMVSVTVTDLQVQVLVSGTSNDVAGELVNSSGTVVDVIDLTSSNPFTLTAPGPGNYIVNAGHKSPLLWDSASVNITLTGVSENQNHPLEYKLYSNYPNPFNPSTTIRYSIPEASFTSIKIYDVIGNEVSSIVNENKPAGIYEAKFNASNLSSGIYFYTIQAGSFKETKKMILLK